MKKRKISLKVIFITLIAITFSLTACKFMISKVTADSGFDGSYDGGSSSYDSSSSDWGSSSSWDDDYSSGSGSSYSSGSPVGFIFVILFFGVITYVIIKISQEANKKMRNGNGLNNQQDTNRNLVIPYDLDNIIKIIPDFDIEDFRMKTFNIYKEIQDAWMNFDNDKLRLYVTDEMYNMYISQLETLKIKNQQNVMKDFALSDFEITNMDSDDKTISITVDALINCYDYIIDTDSKKTLRGKDNCKVQYHYRMTFIKSIIDNKNNFCPNCGAPITDVASQKCPYCNSVIVSVNHDWVLAKKEVIEQHYL